MAIYKLTGGVSSGIDFGNRFVGIPGEAELSDSELEIAKKVASVELVSDSEKNDYSKEDVPDMELAVLKGDYPVTTDAKVDKLLKENK